MEPDQWIQSWCTCSEEATEDLLSGLYAAPKRKVTTLCLKDWSAFALSYSILVYKHMSTLMGFFAWVLRVQIQVLLLAQLAHYLQGCA